MSPVAILMLTASLTAPIPEVVRVRAPAADVEAWFPKGTERIALRPPEFEALVAEARGDAHTPSDEARLLKATHRARWEDGVLGGRTALAVRRDGHRTASIPLEPWDLAVAATADGDDPVRSTDDGRIVLAIPPEGPPEVTVRWTRAARPDREGRVFALGLPTVPLSSLELDLPARFAVEGFAPGPVVDGRRLWRREGATGPIEVRLLDVDGAGGSAGDRAWVSGPSTIEVGPASADWRAEWTVEPARSPGPIRVAFDGVEPTEVAGPDVDSTELARVDGRPEMTVRLRPEARGATRLSLRGVAPVRPDGPWTLPSARPVDADWLGGDVIVRLDRSRAIRSCRVLQGRRLPAPTGGAADRIALAFEPERPGPVAELTFLGASPFRGAEVRGAIRYGESGTVVDVEARWTFPKGRPGDLALDLPASWSIDRIGSGGSGTTWHRDPIGRGTARVRLAPPSIDEEATAYAVQVRALAPPSRTDAPIDLPRVRPVGVATADELWIATADAGRSVVPGEADGLAWIDPAQAGLRAAIDPAELSRALAWRRASADAEASASLVDAPRDVASRVDGTATIADGRLRVDWRLSVRPGARPPAIIPVDWSSPDGLDPRRTLRDPRGPGQCPTSRALTPEERAEFGIPAGSESAEAIVGPDGPPSAPIVVEMTSDREWTGAGEVPIPRLPESFHPRVRLEVRVEPGLATRLESGGARDVEDGPTTVAPASVGATRRDHVLDFRGPDARLRIATSPSLHPVEPPLFNARLVTTWDRAGGAAHELTLHPLTRGPRELSMTMPPGTSLRRVAQGGRTLEVLSVGDSLRVPLTALPDGRAADVVLDYAEPAPARPLDGRRVRPSVPTFPFACPHFTWTVVPTSDLDVTEVGPGLVPLDDAEDRPSPFAIRLPALSRTGSEAVGPATDLGELRRPRPAGLALGAWLTSLARVDRPVIVDRLALDDLGIRPDSPAPASDEAPASEGARPDRLESGDLAFLARGRAIVLTGRAALGSDAILGPEGRPRLDRAIAEAEVMGSSADSRWVAAEQWRLNPPELAPASTSTRLGEASGRTFARDGWPGPESWVGRGPRSDGLAAFAAAMAFIAPGLLIRRLPSRRRSVALGLLVVASSIAVGLLGRSTPGVREGLAVGIASAWLMQPPRRTRLEPEPEAATSGASASGLAGRVLGGLGLLALASVPSSASDPEPSPAILAVFPYEGAPDALARPTRVVLRLADFERLKAAASAASRPAPGRAFAVEASHRVDSADGRAARVVSELAIEVEGDGPVDWLVPIAGAWDVRATLDRRPHPVRVEGDGRFGVVSIRGAGRHRLAIDRAVAIPGPAVAAVEVPINRVPRATVALGRFAPIPAGDPADIGPAREFSIAGPRRADPDAAEGVEGLALWDARPAGDLLRLRVVPGGPGSIADLRLGIEPDAQVMVRDPRRLVRSRRDDRPTGTEWAGSFDPPIARGTPLDLEIWRPLAGSGGSKAVGDRRRSPRVTIVGRPFRGAVAFRRPSDWSGRLDERAGSPSHDEAAFVEAWGRLPDDPFTLSGAVGFRSVVEAEADARPPTPRWSVRPAVQVELGEGRIDVAIEAALRGVSGRPGGLDLDLPDDFLIDRASVDGLASVCRAGPGRLHFELSGLEGASPRLVVRGHRLVSPDRAPGEARRYRARTPWPRWPGAIEEPGLLTVVSVTRPEVEAGPGVAALPLAEPLSGSQQFPVFRAVSRVEPAADAGSVLWHAAPPRVAVFLQSRLVVGRDAAELDATIRYEVAGGPLDVVYLKLPTAWAEGARVEMAGDSFHRTAEARGDWTIWTLRPRHPLWESARLRVRSTRPIEGARGFPFPDIVPLGQGRVEKVLAVERDTTAPIELEGSSGLQAVDASRLDGEAADPSPGRGVGAYRVTGDKWSLTIRVGGPDRRDGPRAGRADVVEAESTCALGPDGTVRASSTFLVDAGPGSSLDFGLGPRAVVLAATAGGRPVPALSTEVGRWSIPLDVSGVSEVVVAWTDRTADPSGARGEVVVPSLDGPVVPTLVRLDALAPVVARTVATGPEPIDGPSWRTERADRLARRASEFIADFDRTSAAQEAELASLLVRSALEWRLAARAVESSTLIEGAASKGSRGPLLLRLERSRQALADGLDLYGLDEFRGDLDLDHPAAETGPPDRPHAKVERAIPDPLPLGGSTYYHSARGATGPVGAIAWERRTGRPDPSPIAWSWAIPAAIGLVLIILRAFGVPGFGSRPVRLGLFILLAGVALVAPLPGAIGLIAAWIGRA